jgi:hypothetical protein
MSAGSLLSIHFRAKRGARMRIWDGVPRLCTCGFGSQVGPWRSIPVPFQIRSPCKLTFLLGIGAMVKKPGNGRNGRCRGADHHGEDPPADELGWYTEVASDIS